MKNDLVIIPLLEAPLVLGLETKMSPCPRANNYAKVGGEAQHYIVPDSSRTREIHIGEFFVETTEKL